MDVKIIATHTCSHCHGLEQELKKLAIVYQILFVEDHPDIVKQYNIRHSPNLLVDGVVLFRKQPSEEELRTLFSGS